MVESYLDNLRQKLVGRGLQFEVQKDGILPSNGERVVDCFPEQIPLELLSSDQCQGYTCYKGQIGYQGFSISIRLGGPGNDLFEYSIDEFFFSNPQRLDQLGFRKVTRFMLDIREKRRRSCLEGVIVNGQVVNTFVSEQQIPLKGMRDMTDQQKLLLTCEMVISAEKFKEEGAERSIDNVEQYLESTAETIASYFGIDGFEP